MTADPQGRRQGRLKLWLAVATLAAILLLLIVPPLVSVSRYRSRITQLVSASLGRPVRLSSVELRMLPRPSFVITDLVVDEDPDYGAEPVLHANTVTASISLVPLWRGALQINRISVDEASLNLVRTDAGRWNLDSFFRTAARHPGSDGAAETVPFPYLEATNSRINIKNGVEKLPYSLVNADMSFWQDSPGDWRVRLRGQPARTDVSLDLPDTGIVRLEASMRRASVLQQMPIHVDLDWREAQLGQLSRLMLGSDEGWRGDLTGELHIDGTADSAQVRSRLRASGVRRAEFAPASPIDFDASCNLQYHYSERGVENLLCDSPIGDGRVRLTGGLPGHGGLPHLALEMDRVPAQVALDALRTVRNGLDPSLAAGGSISGQISYQAVAAPATPAPVSHGHARGQSAKSHPQPPGPLTGSLIVTGLRLTGDSLGKPVQMAKVTIDPAPGDPAALAASVAILAGAPAPLNLTARLSLDNYQMQLRGSVSLARLREMGRMLGFKGVSVLDQVDGQPAVIDMTAEGPWLSSIVPLPRGSSAAASTDPEASTVFVVGSSDRVSGTVALHDETWKAGFLANPVQVGAATLHLENGDMRWDPIAFTYGPVKGTATLALPVTCQSPDACAPRFSIDFGTLDAAALQAAILGARQSGTMLSSLIARLRPGATPGWPELQGSIRADSLVLPPVTLGDVSATMRIVPTGAEIENFDGALLGGHIRGSGTITSGDKPAYKLNCDFSKLDAAKVGQLLGMTWSGGGLDGAGQIELSGFTDKDLAASAKGSLRYDWRNGSVAGATDLEAPPALAKFDRWTAEAEIGDGGIKLKQNQVQHGPRKLAVEGSAVFGDPPTVTLGSSQDVRAAKR